MTVHISFTHTHTHKEEKKEGEMEGVKRRKHPGGNLLKYYFSVEDTYPYILDFVSHPTGTHTFDNTNCYTPIYKSTMISPLMYLTISTNIF